MQVSVKQKASLMPNKLNYQHGLSLIELMIAVAIGMLLTLMLTALLVHMSSANREQFKASEQIENGRFAIDLISNDIRLAGYYGEFSALPLITSYSSQPDPCSIPSDTSAGPITTSTTNSALAFYIQGYPAASLTASASVPPLCQAWIDSASIKPGSDIIVVKRLDTIPLINPPTTSSTTLSAGQVYAQTTSDTLDIQYSVAATIDTSKTARNTATTLIRKDYSQATVGGIRPTIAAYIRKLHVDIYFVSPCRAGSGTNGKCTNADDTIPTLKRLELTASGGAPTMTLVPLAEGIEFLKIRYGLDTTLDGVVDSTVTEPTTIADWQNIVLVEVRLIARNSESTNGYSDSKSYDLGNSVTYTPTGSALTYKRHAFSQKIYLPNIGGRREL